MAPSVVKAGEMAACASLDSEPATAALWVSIVNFSELRITGSTLGSLTTTYRAPHTSYLRNRGNRASQTGARISTEWLEAWQESQFQVPPIGELRMLQQSTSTSSIGMLHV